MSKTEDAISKLRVLYDQYTGKRLEAALGVTTKSIQNYLKVENAQRPGDNVIERINEAFAKHERGEKIERTEVPVIEGGSILNEAILNLSVAAKKHAETDATNARNIERLIELLEAKPSAPGLVPPGTPGTIPINKKQEKTSR